MNSMKRNINYCKLKLFICTFGWGIQLVFHTYICVFKFWYEGHVTSEELFFTTSFLNGPFYQNKARVKQCRQKKTSKINKGKVEKYTQIHCVHFVLLLPPPCWLSVN